MVTMQSWMFLSSYDVMRGNILNNRTVQTMAHLGARAFGEISGEVVQTTAFVLQKHHQIGFKPVFFRLVDGLEAEKAAALESGKYRHDQTVQDDFKKIPGGPIAYWVGDNVRNAFERMQSFRELGNPKVGMQTSNNGHYLRFWWEIRFNEVGESAFSAAPKWIAYLKGGPFRRWYGNLEYLLRYNHNADYILAQPNATVLPLSRLSDPKCSWTDLTSGPFNCRLAPNRSFHDISGHCFYPSKNEQYFLLGVANSKPFDFLLSLVNATFHFQVGDVGKIPVPEVHKDTIRLNTEKMVSLSKVEWDSRETSWDFGLHSWAELNSKFQKLSDSWTFFSKDQNNRILIDAYGLQTNFLPRFPKTRSP
jgi:hypothetical protein